MAKHSLNLFPVTTQLSCGLGTLEKQLLLKRRYIQGNHLLSVLQRTLNRYTKLLRSHQWSAV